MSYQSNQRVRPLSHTPPPPRSGGRIQQGAPRGMPLFMRTAANLLVPTGRLAHLPSPTAGQPLTAGERNRAEMRTGVDLAGAQVHADRQAQRAALRLGAHAFTLGEHIYLGPTVGRAGGPSRQEVLLHELIHVAQVRHGQRNGRLAGPNAVETEAINRADHSGHAAVQQGADAGTPHGIFLLPWLTGAAVGGGAAATIGAAAYALFNDEVDPAEASSAGYESSRLGMQRSVWAHVVEAVKGVAEVGPLDAYNAAFGEDAEAAGELGWQYHEDPWQENAARHGVWQARLAYQHGASAAEVLGDAHEVGSPDALDSWIDQYNNRVAREIGESAASPEEIPALVEAALADGRLISAPDDDRIPEALRRSE